MRIDNDGIGLHVAADGPEDGPPVLFLHGISGSTATYDFLVPELPDHRLLRLDFRGHGTSDRTPDGYLLEGFASDAEAVLDQVVGGPAVIVGHSLGGLTATYVAQRRPDLVTALFLEDPPLFFDRATYESTAFANVFPLMQAAIVAWQSEGASAEQIGAAMAAVPSMSGQGTMGDENMPDAMTSTGYALHLLDPTVFDPVIAGTSIGSYDPAFPYGAPGVLLQPDRELGAAFFGDHAARLAAAAPQIDVVEVHGVGHLIHDSRTHRAGYLGQLRTFLDLVGAGMIVDPHHHLWVHPTNPYMAPELHADTATVPDLAKTVFVECGSGYRTDGPEAFKPVGETEFVVAADPTGFVAGIVGFADLTRPEVADVLAAHVAAGQGRFRGIRHASAHDPSPDIRESHTKPPPGLLGQDDFRRGFAALGAAGLSFDAWMFHPQLPELVDLCHAVPDTPVILDHLGGPLGIGPYAGKRDEVLAGWRQSMAEVAACDNVVLKLGGIGMAIYGMRWHKEGGASPEQLVEVWGEPIRWCIETFGPQRCMFESNFPVDKVSCTYADLWRAFDLIVADASPTDREDLFAGTASRAYRL